MSELGSIFDLSYAMNDVVNYVSSSEGISDVLWGLGVAGFLTVVMTKIQSDSDREQKEFYAALETNELLRDDEEFGNLEDMIFPKRFYGLQKFYGCGDIECLQEGHVVLKPPWRKGLEGIWQRLDQGELTLPKAFNMRPSLAYMTNSENMYGVRYEFKED